MWQDYAWGSGSALLRTKSAQEGGKKPSFGPYFIGDCSMSMAEHCPALIPTSSLVTVIELTDTF